MSDERHGPDGLWGPFEVDDERVCANCGQGRREVICDEFQGVCQPCYVALHARDCGCGVDVAGETPPRRTVLFHFYAARREGLDTMAAARRAAERHKADPRSDEPREAEP